MDDITIPDDTVVFFGATIDKQWLVTNSGTCSWDFTYRLKWIGGETFGALEEQSLFPARSGTQATLRIFSPRPQLREL